jgi:hypothetical protein
MSPKMRFRDKTPRRQNPRKAANWRTWPAWPTREWRWLKQEVTKSRDRQLFYLAVSGASAASADSTMQAVGRFSFLLQIPAASIAILPP